MTKNRKRSKRKVSPASLQASKAASGLPTTSPTGSGRNSGNRSNCVAGRNSTLDSLRGLAILLMIADHVAWLYFDQHIAWGTLRFFTRPSMPLFCVLAGYFLGHKWHGGASARADAASIKPAANWLRLGQVAVAAAIVDFCYFTLFGQVEILASLLVCFLLAAALGRWFAVLALAFLAMPLESAWLQTANGLGLFDFPICVVATCMAVGFVSGWWRLWSGTVFSVLILSGLIFDKAVNGSFTLVSEPTVFVLLFLPLASALCCLGTQHPRWKIPVLEWMGRYPLSIYVAQYLILLMFAPNL